jgi:vancomycin resistance protein YoaR
LNAGLPIVERHAHAYRVGYYENDSQPGFDATVFAPTNDLKIKNDTPAYILVQTEIDKENNLLYFKLYGKKDNRRSEISKIALYDLTPPPPSLYQDDPTLKKGVIKQVDYAASGGKASFHYQVTKDNQTIIDQDFLSLFKPWQAVYLVGTAD